MFEFGNRSPERDYIIIFSDGDHYYITYAEHCKYVALYGRHDPFGCWCYPESVPTNQKVYGRP